jgi:hypothetical protein
LGTPTPGQSGDVPALAPAVGAEITAKVSDLAKAFVRDVPVQDTSDEWIDARNGKHSGVSDLRKVVSTYRANVQTIDEGGEGSADEADNPYRQARRSSAGPEAMVNAEANGVEEEDDELMYNTARSGTTTAPTRMGTDPPSGKSKSSTGGAGGNKFSQFSLPSTTVNDWLDDEPTASQRAAAREAYARRAGGSAVPAACSNDEAVSVRASSPTPAYHAVPAPFSPPCAVVPAQTPRPPTPPRPLTTATPVSAQIPAMSWTSASTMSSTNVQAHSSVGPFSPSSAFAAPPSSSSAGSAPAQQSLLQILNTHRAQDFAPAQQPSTVHNTVRHAATSNSEPVTSVSSGAAPNHTRGGGGGLSEDVKRHVASPAVLSS